MLTRNTAEQIQRYWEQSQDPAVSAVQQFEAMMRAGLLLARATINIVDAAQNHWDNSGAGAAVLAATNGEAAGNGGGCPAACAGADANGAGFIQSRK